MPSGRLIVVSGLFITLYGCSNFDEDFQQPPAGSASIATIAPVPSAIQNAQLPNNCLKAWMSIGNNPKQEMQINNHQASFSESMDTGLYNITVEFACINTGYGSDGTVLLASATREWNASENTTELVFEETNFLPLIDSDNDGDNNIVELENNTDPFSAATQVGGNSAPVADSGADQNVYVGDLVSLDGSKSYDPDSDSLSYLWNVEVVPSATGQSSLITQVNQPTDMSPSFTPDVPGLYVFSLVVNDGKVSSSNINSVTISASINQTPLANAGPDQTVEVNNNVTLDGSASSDPESEPLSYAWQLVSSPVTVNLSYPTPSTATFTPTDAGIYKFALQVDDGRNTSPPDTVIISVTLPAGQNSAPVANAGLNRNIVAGTTIQLDGSQSSDVDTDPLTYHWTVQAPPGSAVTAIGNLPTPDQPNFTADVAGDYIITLVVNDGLLDSAPSSITIHASAANQAPVADAGAIQIVIIGNPVTLDGSASYDNNADPLTYSWSFTAVPAGSKVTTTSFNDNTLVSPTFTPDIPGAYNVSLVVNDGTFSSTPSETRVDVKIPSEGTLASPVLLNFPTDLPYHGSVIDTDGAFAGTSYYLVSGLTAGRTYSVSIANMTENANLNVYQDTAHTTLLCTQYNGTLSERRCLATAASDSLAVSPTGSYSFVDFGTYFDLNLTPLVAQGSASTPVNLDASLLPFNGVVDNSASYYAISGLSAGTRYVITSYNMLQNVDLYVYADPNDFAASTATPLCSSKVPYVGFAGLDACFATSTNNTLYVKIDGSNSTWNYTNQTTHGSPFQFNIELPPSAEGTLNAPVSIAATTLPYTGTVDLTDSYYRLDGLTAGATYNIDISNMIQDGDLYVYADAGFSDPPLCSSNFAASFETCSAAVPAGVNSLYIRMNGANTFTGTRFDLNIR